MKVMLIVEKQNVLNAEGVNGNEELEQLRWTYGCTSLHSELHNENEW